jgi:hypothetical protein
MGWVVNATPRPLYPRYPLCRRSGGPHGRSGRVRKISPLPGLDPRTVQPVASHNTDWAIELSRSSLPYIYIYVCIKLKDHISEMFRLLYTAIFRLQLKNIFDIQLAMSLIYKISCSLLCISHFYISLLYLIVISHTQIYTGSRILKTTPTVYQNTFCNNNLKMDL